MYSIECESGLGTCPASVDAGRQRDAAGSRQTLGNESVSVGQANHSQPVPRGKERGTSRIGKPHWTKIMPGGRITESVWAVFRTGLVSLSNQVLNRPGIAGQETASLFVGNQLMCRPMLVNMVDERGVCWKSPLLSEALYGS